MLKISSPTAKMFMQKQCEDGEIDSNKVFKTDHETEQNDFQ